MSFVYLDGEFISELEAKIPVTNRGFLFGDGVYATLQVNDGHPLFFETHLTSLKEHALSFGLKPLDVPLYIIHELIQKNKASKGVWKLKIILFAGEEPEMFLPARDAKHLLITLKPFEVPPYQPLKLAVFPKPVETAHTAFKSLAHLGRYFVMEHAKKTGLDDAVTTTEQGLLLEAAFGNLFWLESGTLFTPDPSLPLHFGVTIRKVIEFAKERGWNISFVKMRLEEVPQGAYLYRCNTMSGIRPIIKLGSREFPRENSLETIFKDYPLLFTAPLARA
jgi:branched-subunit amino acid aminotransferase/4-amino-4-deoxychorismate lyase